MKIRDELHRVLEGTVHFIFQSGMIPYYTGRVATLAVTAIKDSLYSNIKPFGEVNNLKITRLSVRTFRYFNDIPGKIVLIPLRGGQ